MLDSKKLRALMEEKGYGCNALAEKIGSVPAHVSHMMNDNYVSNLRLSTLDKLCDALQCKPEDLLK